MYFAKLTFLYKYHFLQPWNSFCLFLYTWAYILDRNMTKQYLNSLGYTLCGSIYILTKCSNFYHLLKR